MSQLGLPLTHATSGPVGIAPGAVWVRGWLDGEAQLPLVNAFHEWAAPSAGLRRPKMPNGAPFSTQAVCLGWHWYPLPLQPNLRRRRRHSRQGVPRSPRAARRGGLRRHGIPARHIRRCHRQPLRAWGKAGPPPGQDRRSRGRRRPARRWSRSVWVIAASFVSAIPNGQPVPTGTLSRPAATSSFSAARLGSRSTACRRRMPVPRPRTWDRRPHQRDVAPDRTVVAKWRVSLTRRGTPPAPPGPGAGPCPR